MTWTRRVLAVVAFARRPRLPLLVASRAPATRRAARSASGPTTSQMQIEPDGMLAVARSHRLRLRSERAARHPARSRPQRTYDDDNDRRYEIDVTGVSTSAGTPDDVQLSDEGDFRRIRIGDPEPHDHRRAHATRSTTRSTGARCNPSRTTTSCTGTRSATSGRCRSRPCRCSVEAPADITEIACFTGPDGSSLAVRRGDGVRFHRRRSGTTALGAGAGMTIVVGLPKGAIEPEPEPILDERRTLEDAFAVNAGNARHQRRPRRCSASAAVERARVAARSRPPLDRLGRRRRDGQRHRRRANASRWVRRDAGPSSSSRPTRCGPGQVGTLIDEQANLLDVTATIVDLAVRGYITITEIAEDGTQARLRAHTPRQGRQADAPRVRAAAPATRCSRAGPT